LKSFRWVTLSVLASLATFLLPGQSFAQALPPSQRGAAAAVVPDNLQPVDRIVAIVNSDVITRRQLDQRVALIAHRLQQQNAPIPSTDQLELQVLDQMVVERVQLQKAAEDGITVDDPTVQRTVDRLAQSNHMTVNEYRARLTAQGVPWDMFISDARTELLLSKLREREVDSKITVSDAEVVNYIASQRGPNAGVVNDLHLQHILFKLPANASAADIEAARQKAAVVLQEALGGKDFGRLARANSQAPDAAKGGDLGFQPQDKLAEAYVRAAASLRPGEVDSELVRSDDGLDVLKLVERRASQGRAGDAPKMVQTHVRHILLRVGDGSTSEASVRQKLLDIRQQIEGGGDFGQFARSYSQDGSASRGGDLGWISPGETVPEFERAMNNLPDGQVSGPVRTEYGYHLIQVMGRRDAQGSAAQQQELARQVIGQRKAEQAFSDWLRQLRDSAYVQYKLGAPAA
jgi:peptidyl-prolyl cis-trans isomerase SurA